MKAGIHPEYMPTKVKCNGCGISFETRSTVPEITVEICSNCHPFYTGKQKLVDTAGRVDKFRARQQAAAKKQAKAVPAKTEPAPAEVEKIEQEFESKTVELSAPENPAEQSAGTAADNQDAQTKATAESPEAGQPDQTAQTES